MQAEGSCVNQADNGDRNDSAAAITAVVHAAVTAVVPAAVPATIAAAVAAVILLPLLLSLLLSFLLPLLLLLLLLLCLPLRWCRIACWSAHPQSAAASSPRPGEWSLLLQRHPRDHLMCSREQQGT
jgi:hypothetical protein